MEALSAVVAKMQADVVALQTEYKRQQAYLQNELSVQLLAHVKTNDDFHQTISTAVTDAVSRIDSVEDKLDKKIIEREVVEATVTKFVEQIGNRIGTVPTDSRGVGGPPSLHTGSGAGSGAKSLLQAKQMLPEKFNKEEMWRRWRVHVEDYCEEVKGGMKKKMEEVRKLKTQVNVDDVGQEMWAMRETLFRFLTRYTCLLYTSPSPRDS